MKNLFILSVFILLGVEAAFSQQIFNESQKKRLDLQYASPLFRDLNAYMFVPNEDPSAMGSQSVFQYLQGRVPGLIIDNSLVFSPSAYWRNSRTAFFLNEMRVDASTIANLNINDIGLVKAFRPPFIGAIGNGPGGAIALYISEEEEGMGE